MTLSTAELVELLKGMVAIPSLSREETAVADYVETWLKRVLAANAMESAVELHRKGNNVWLEQPGRGDSRPVVLLNGHIDTVKPAAGYTREPFAATVEGDTIYGLGTNDDGASVVALLGAFFALIERPQPYRLIWSATAEEEVCGSNGIELIVPEIGPVALGVIGEPTGMQMAVAEKGLLVLDCVAHGVSGHAARSEGVNALYKALDDIDWFRTYQFEKVSEFLGPVKMTATMIQCGSQHNVVPAECSFVVDVRPNGLYSNVEIVETIKAHVGCDVNPRSLRHNSSSIDVAHPIVRRGLSLGLAAFGSPTTSNQTVVDFTTIKIGPGESSRSHTADEFIRISEICNGVGTYVKLLDGLKLN